MYSKKRLLLTISIGMVLGKGYAHAATVSPFDVLGFEVATDWTSTTVQPTLSTQHTEGSSSLAVKAVGYTLLKSVPFSISSPLGSTISLDLLLPTQQPNPNWFGAVQLYVDCPSKNVFNAFVGQVELTGLKVNVFNSLSFPVAQSVQNSIGVSCSNLDLSIAVNVPSNATGTYLLDDIQGVGVTATAPIPTDTRSRTFYMVPDPSVSADLLATVSTYQIQEWPFENTVDVKTAIGTQSFEAVTTVNNTPGAPLNVSFWFRLQDMIVYGQHEIDVVSDSIVNGQHVQKYRVFSVVNSLNGTHPAGFDAGAVDLIYVNGQFSSGSALAEVAKHSKRLHIPASFAIPGAVVSDASRIVLAGFWSSVEAPFKAIAHAATDIYHDVSHASLPQWAEFLGSSILASLACWECAGAVAGTVGTEGAAAPSLPALCAACGASLLLEFSATANLGPNGNDPTLQSEFIIANPLCTRCLSSPPTPVCFCDSGFTSSIVNGQCQCVPEAGL